MSHRPLEQAEPTLQKQEKRLIQLQEFAKVGLWELDIATGKLSWSSEIYKMHGKDPATFSPTLDYLLNSLSVTDRERMQRKLKTAIETGQKQHLSHKLVREDGTEVFIELVGHIEYDENQTPIKAVGISSDITHLIQLERRYQELAHLMQIAHQEIYIFDYHNLRYLYANDCALNNLGYTLEELTQLTVLDTNPYLTLEHVEKLKALEGSQKTVTNLSIHQRKNGSRYPVKAILQHLPYQGQDAVVLFDTDISELKNIEAQLTQQKELMENVLETVPVRIFWKDLAGKYLGANQLFLSDAQLESQQQLIGKTDYDLPWQDDQGDYYFQTDMAIIESGQSTLTQQESYVDEDGSEKTWLVSRMPLKNGQQQIVGMLGTYEDITERRNLEIQLKHQTEILKHQAHHDELTQLPNRTLFNNRLQYAIEKAKRAQTAFAVHFIDLDQFKKINDSLGHDIGDEVLKIIANRIRRTIRAEDTLARLGGDEFTILQESLNSPQDAVTLAQKILDATHDPIQVTGHTFLLSNSIGMSLYPKDADTPEDLLKYADAAMYRAKDEGRNNFQFYTEELSNKAFEQMAMQSSLRQALHQQEFLVYYQPQYHAVTEKLIGMEALVRWQHPTKGLLPPIAFIPVAEESNLIVELDRQVMRGALHQLKHWFDLGLNPPKLSLNLTVKHLQQDDFIEKLDELLKQSNCKPEWIEFEITESNLMENLEKMNFKLTQLKQFGFHIAIDDFGTGYSSLAYLKRLPVTKLKIDKSFILDLPQDEEDAVITKTMIAMAESLGLTVIAEGVETLEQKSFLINHQCYQHQGYYYSRPISSLDMTEILSKLAE
ncbi:hypothetical protein CYQ88_04980 [Hydrogenovibrio sp. SC-1]|uniref:EAL domain-containing protein n=1 Tax=Hydrogenovibrio sp. SC-1 TaxID=2065820 RepID=UPI000C7B7022|nr:EAL domain-containing protein [Hydrogenovibrio sp. SC-1]PLA74666.1 hypothetical protein CYQ88_04980 [Hydrogenovibrio sp. SC-1]